MNAGATHDQARTIRMLRLTLCALTACLVWIVPFNSDAHAASGARLDSHERGIVREINRVRAKHGLKRFKTLVSLSRSADFHSRDMIRANFFGHASSNGTPMPSRVRRYRRAKRIGENLAYVPTKQRRRGPRVIVRMWMNSTSHRQVLLSPSFRRIGLARRIGRLGGMRAVVYTADFASAR